MQASGMRSLGYKMRPLSGSGVCRGLIWREASRSALAPSTVGYLGVKLWVKAKNSEAQVAVRTILFIDQRSSLQSTPPPPPPPGKHKEPPPKALQSSRCKAYRQLNSSRRSHTEGGAGASVASKNPAAQGEVSLLCSCLAASSLGLVAHNPYPGLQTNLSP